MKEQDTIDPESQTTIGPRSKVRLELVIALVAGVGWVGWVTSELNTVKGLVTAKNDNVANVQGEVRSVQADVKILTSKMDQFEKNGSQPMQALQKSIDEIRFKLDAHMNQPPK